MKMKAAVCREFGKPLRIEEVHLAPPKEREVLIRTMYTGFCHSDWSAVAGYYGFPAPWVPGHESSGIVEEVGPGVTSLRKGDRVVATWMITCGGCKMCTSGRGHICSTSHSIHMKGGLWDGTSRLTDARGERLYHQTFVSGFAEYMVIPEQGAIKVRDDFPLDQACLLACCMPTGLGAVNNVANVKPGNSVAIWGMGGVGLNVVQAAKRRGAKPLIGVDLEGSKEDIAATFGVGHFIDSSKEDPVPRIQELTEGGADFCFEVVGDPGALVQAYWALGIGGKLIMVGMPSIEKMVGLPLMLTPAHNRDVIGTLYGNVRTHHDLPRFMDMITDRDFIDLGKLITRRFKLDEINEVYQAMTKRQIVGRWVCSFE
jgi:S-(hydroxymethyl)glutathione dehydrogenase / alcohol dehydrogenase